MENIEGNKVWENGGFYRFVCSVFNSYSHVRISLRFVSAFFFNCDNCVFAHRLTWTGVDSSLFDELSLEINLKTQSFV